MRYDVVIVGAGSAGCVLANRLSADPARSVCLVEAGGRDRSPFIHVPFGLAVIARLRSIGWGYETVPQGRLGGRRLFWPRGKVVGGSSSINAMCYVRGAPEDYEGWGVPGWSWSEVEPTFEAHLAANGGPLPVATQAEPNPLSHAFVAAANTVQLPARPLDENRGPAAGLYRTTTRDGRRASSAFAFLRPALDRPNLDTMTDARVVRLAMNGSRAVGVVVRDGDREETIEAREVVLASGTIGSPHLLMLSGIGPARHLAEHGISPAVDAPEVGRNLADHLDVIVSARGADRSAYAMDPRAAPTAIRAAWRYALRRRGMLASNVAEAGGFARSRHADDAPAEADIQFHFLPALVADHGRRATMGYGMSVHACCLYPHARGSIRLASASPDDAPLIDPNYLADERDLDVLEDAANRARAMLGAPPMAGRIRRELAPGPDVSTSAELRDWIRSDAETVYHPVGTCRMGTDEASVVDEHGRVRGTQGLRVADASIMPRLIGGNTNAPTMMIAERIAARMIADETAGKPSRAASAARP